ncbi:protein SCAR3 isoform X1 [Ricinus communis]|uniref:protein SCAR3 isoform X1 n=1 Tax=Ricinus communis TaxID=3988 RepID=UPI00201AB2DE|nr:protein SCAR3 isoform X1 [Ricinus communis]
MPLVRFQVRNEYRLGQSELYREANREDPKAVLDGVAVAGLVGILRQLGDLAEFAAEVFHGLQEQVTTTASRSHKLMVRVQNIEAALPSLEKAVLAQTSHIHFAYTAGSEWHSRIQNGQNHFIYNDLPRFIMDSYEECSDPPRLHLLDKFDTGGPGSCLKRYSDPTFFRRASGNFKEPDAEKVRKEKKVRKTKKKRSSQRNVDFLSSASMLNQSARMPFSIPTVNGRTSPSHTASTTDMTLKSDLGDHSNSFDSRTGSAYVECVFHLSSSAQPEEQESKEFSARFLHHNNIADSVIPNEQPSIVTDNSHQSSSPEPIVHNSSSDIWDEKAEIVEPEDLQSDENEAPDMFITDSDLGIRNENALNLRNPYQLDLAFDNEDTLKSSTDGNELDEIESEPDNFMDALNTIDSESENDLDCLTRHEVEQFSSIVNNQGIQDDVDKVTEHLSDDPSGNESHNPSELSLNKGTTSDLGNNVQSNSFSHEHTSHISGDPSNSDNLPGMESFTAADALDSLNVESFVSASDPSSSGCGMSSMAEPLSDKAVSHSCKSQEPQAELATVQPVSFWTNGGLLGLEPSKPPDFAVANTSNMDSETRINSEVIGHPNHFSMPSNDGERGRPDILVKDDRSTERDLTSERSSSQHKDQDSEVEKTGDFHPVDRFNHADGERHNITSVVKPGNELPIDANIKDTCIGENEKNSSQMFGLGHRLLINGFRRKISLVPDSQCEQASSLRTSASDQRNGHHRITHHAAADKTLDGKFGHKTNVGSLTSSPPLEHMKISFHPIDSFEASKLNLKFPDGNHNNGSTRDMFPAFQLVPEPTIPLKDAGSDSDDDTFCRSSPYLSDDCLSHHSDSDSEKWESDESPENKDHELYDSLCRIPPVESVSSSLQPTEMGNDGIHMNSGLKSLYSENGADSSLSSSLLDLPSFDAMNPVILGKSKDNLEQRNYIESQYSEDPNPSPPPPPPVQWWATKATAYMAQDKQKTTPEVHKHPVDLKLSEFPVSQQHKPAPANEKQTDEEITAFKPKGKQEECNLSPLKEANMPEKGMDEKEDFLHQIRRKSFTLRRTVAAKPTFAAGPAANDKVTAILEKAIAIRQAVGSDDGEDDDTWSDA